MFGTKLFSGVGYPTPLSIPDTTTCLIIQVPASDEWWALTVGLLYELTLEWRWQQFEGGIDRDSAAARWFTMLDDALSVASVTNGCSLDVPTPYWALDSADDADDQMPADTQIWYGEIVALPALMAGDELTFLDNVGIWAIGGFIAYAGLPGAAIAFVPLAKKFVLAFKQHSLGGVVSVLVDFLHLADIDTYGVEDGVINTTVSIPDDGESHTLYVQMSDEHNPAVTDPPNIQVIRKRLDESEVTPSNLRWNVDCDCVQQTPDGGGTWVDSPTQDPRSSTIFQVPARTTGDPKCDSAQQMHDRIKHMLDAIIASASILEAINSVIGVIAVFFFEFGIVIEAIWALISAIFGIGTTVLAAALTDDQYDLLLCILYCGISSDGTVTAEQFANIKTNIGAQLNSTAAFAINNALDSIGFVGLTNAGALGEVTGDCAACSCCDTFDVTYITGRGDGVGTNPTSVVPGGTYTFTAQEFPGFPGVFSLAFCLSCCLEITSSTGSGTLGASNHVLCGGTSFSHDELIGRCWQRINYGDGGDGVYSITLTFGTSSCGTPSDFGSCT